MFQVVTKPDDDAETEHPEIADKTAESASMHSMSTTELQKKRKRRKVVQESDDGSSWQQAPTSVCHLLIYTMQAVFIQVFTVISTVSFVYLLMFNSYM